MSKDFLKDLKEKPVLVCDGAMGSELQSMGLKMGECPEEWNVTHPEKVKAVHQGYVDAGSDIIQTNTFGANRIKVAAYKMADRVAELNKAAVKIAREVADEQVYISTSVGPTGKFLPPLGDLSEPERIFDEQIRALADAGVDLIIIETFSDLDEILAALRAAKSTGLPTICTMTFDQSGRTMMGTTPQEVAKVLTAEGADVIGANCGTGPEDMEKIIAQMRQAIDTYLIAQPNAGLPKLIKNKTVYDATPELMAEYAEKFVKLGVKIVGACCGSTPQHLKAIVQRVKTL